MLRAGENRCLMVILENLDNIEHSFIERTLIKSDTNKDFEETLKDLYKELIKNNSSINEIKYFFEPDSNINEKDMVDSELYCITYTRKDGSNVAILNMPKKQVLRRFKTLKMSLQTEAYDYGSLYRMKDIIEAECLMDKYSDTFVALRKEIKY